MDEAAAIRREGRMCKDLLSVAAPPGTEGSGGLKGTGVLELVKPVPLACRSGKAWLWSGTSAPCGLDQLLLSLCVGGCRSYGNKFPIVLCRIELLEGAFIRSLLFLKALLRFLNLNFKLLPPGVVLHLVSHSKLQAQVRRSWEACLHQLLTWLSSQELCCRTEVGEVLLKTGTVL